jgi:two-component sensor histidine kinase
MTELLTNALKYGVRPGFRPEIRIEASRGPDGWVTVTLRDNGPGIPRDKDPAGAGTLGLRLVRELVVEQLEGELDFDGSRGTCWTIRWPDR